MEARPSHLWWLRDSRLFQLEQLSVTMVTWSGDGTVL